MSPTSTQITGRIGHPAWCGDPHWGAFTPGKVQQAPIDVFWKISVPSGHMKQNKLNTRTQDYQDFLEDYYYLLRVQLTHLEAGTVQGFTTQ